MMLFAIGVKGVPTFSVDRSNDAHFRKQHWPAILGGIN